MGSLTSSELNRLGAKTMARFWGVILLTRDWRRGFINHNVKENKQHRISKKNNTQSIYFKKKNPNSQEQTTTTARQLAYGHQLYAHHTTTTTTTTTKYTAPCKSVVYLDSDIYKKVEQPRHEGTRGGRQRGHDFPRVRLRVARAHQAWVDTVKNLSKRAK